MPRRYRVVDVFAERRLAGNPLTVVIDGGGLSTEEMQATALEANHSETTFITADRPNAKGWPVRIFTPGRELPFAGHPTLGTAAVIMEAFGAKAPLTLDLKIGPIPVAKEGDLLWMRQKTPTFPGTYDSAKMAACLGLGKADIDDRFPFTGASTALPVYIVPLRSLKAANKARLDLALFRKTLGTPDIEQVLVFAPETESPKAKLHVRCFTEAFGIAEDPATGSANGSLAGWLSRNQYFGSPHVDIAVEQGIEIARPSMLHLRADGPPDAIQVEVGGRVVAVAEGVFVDDAPAVRTKRAVAAPSR